MILKRAGMYQHSNQGESMDTTYNLNGAFKPTAKRFADLNGPDFFPTPEWATHALMDNERFEGNVWEPACGDGSMAEVIKHYGNDVMASDLFDRGYGEFGIDFLITGKVADNIITNPPYNAAEGFICAGLKKSRRKFALLLRLAFLEGANRQRTIFKVNPPARIWIFSERITFYPAGQIQAGSGTTAYAWFIWDHSHIGVTELKWLPLGYKARSYAKSRENPMLFK
jgi:hypothetical protein